MSTPIRKTDVQLEKPSLDPFARKQQWKELPGHRYTPEELRNMADSIGPFVITEQAPHVMRLE
jgi:hypothetical protein